MALPGSRSIAWTTPGNVCSGWIESVIAPASPAAASDSRDTDPERCRTDCPGCNEPATARHVVAMASSGTPMMTTVAAAAASASETNGSPGRNRSTRARDPERPEAATTRCPASASSTPSAVPTLPAPTTAISRGSRGSLREVFSAMFRSSRLRTTPKYRSESGVGTQGSRQGPVAVRGNPDLDHRASSRIARHPGPAAGKFRALAHGNHPQVARRRSVRLRRDAHAVVLDSHQHAAVMLLEPDFDMVRPGVFPDVRQRLLGDAIQDVPRFRRGLILQVDLYPVTEKI